MIVEIVNIIRKKDEDEQDSWKGEYKVEDLRRGYGMILNRTDSYKCLRTSRVLRIKFFDDRSLLVVETMDTKYELKVLEW